MKKAVLVLACALVAGISFALAPLNAQPAADAPAVQKWEYAVESVDRSKFSPDALNMRGSEGWELVTVTDFGGFIHYYFKRLKP